MPSVYEIELTPEALEDLRALKRFEQKEVLAGIESQPTREPTIETRNRKKMRPNDVAEWALRIGRFRVFYNVEADLSIVSIEAIAFKLGGVLFLHGEETEL